MNKTIHYEDLIYRNKQIDSLKQKGFIIIPKKKFKTLGYIFIGVGILTYPIPFTSIPLILIGLTMLGLSYQVLLEKLRRKIKLLFLLFKKL